MPKTDPKKPDDTNTRLDKLPGVDEETSLKKNGVSKERIFGNTLFPNANLFGVDEETDAEGAIEKQRGNAINTTKNPSHKH